MRRVPLDVPSSSAAAAVAIVAWLALIAALAPDQPIGPTDEDSLPNTAGPTNTARQAARLDAAALSAGPFFIGLGDLPGGIHDSVACDVSADGSVVVGYSNSAQGMEAFRWTPDGSMVGLRFPRAYAVSADGSVVVGYRHIGARTEPVRWTHPHDLAPFGKLKSEAIAEALDVSADGSVIVGRGQADVGQACVALLWSKSGGIAGSGAHRFIEHGEARAVSADGAVVVGLSKQESGGGHAFRWTKDTGAVLLGPLPGHFRSIAHDVSGDGSIVVGCSDSKSATQAFRWTQETGMVGIGALTEGSCNSTAFGVSADGSRLVGQCYTESGFQAFVWDAANGIRKVREILVDHGLGAQVADWKLTVAQAVSADGQVIVGMGLNPNGDREAWIARLAHCSR